MTSYIRRESDNIVFEMLGKHAQALIHMEKSMEDMAECLKQCQMVNIINEQKEMRDQIKWIKRIGLSVVSVFGLAIFFLLMGHPIIFQKFIDKFYK